MWFISQGLSWRRKKTKWPFILLRRQFPIHVSYAMIINKSQGQTLNSVGLYHKTPVFSHGQLYVAVSRVTSRQSLKILVVDEDTTCGSQTKNVVYPEVFRSVTLSRKWNAALYLYIFLYLHWCAYFLLSLLCFMMCFIVHKLAFVLWFVLSLLTAPVKLLVF